MYMLYVHVHVHVYYVLLIVVLLLTYLDWFCDACSIEGTYICIVVVHACTWMCYDVHCTCTYTCTCTCNCTCTYTCMHEQCVRSSQFSVCHVIVCYCGCVSTSTATGCSFNEFIRSVKATAAPKLDPPNVLLPTPSYAGTATPASASQHKLKLIPSIAGSSTTGKIAVILYLESCVHILYMFE